MITIVTMDPTVLCKGIEAMALKAKEAVRQIQRDLLFVALVVDQLHLGRSTTHCNSFSVCCNEKSMWWYEG